MRAIKEYLVSIYHCIFHKPYTTYRTEAGVKIDIDNDGRVSVDLSDEKTREAILD